MFLKNTQYILVRPSYLRASKTRTGFTLLETIVAIYVLLSGVVGSMSLVSENLKVLSYFRDQLVAANLAQEGAELVRNRRDSNHIACAKRNTCPSPSPGFDFNTNNMNGITGDDGPCDDLYGCRVKLPLPQGGSPEFEACPSGGSGGCEFLKFDPDAGYNIGYDISGKYSRKITVTKVSNYDRGTLDPLYDWRVNVRVEWQDRLVGTRSVEVNDVLTPHLRY